VAYVEEVDSGAQQRPHCGVECEMMVLGWDAPAEPAQLAAAADCVEEP
jgi:hypothetical protein